jgi:phosphoribosylformylglycinamidine synthase
MKFKAKVYIRLRAAVDDSAGNAVRQACGRLSDLSMQKLRLGKLIEIDFEADTEEYANQEIEKLSNRLFANGVIEDYEFNVWEASNETPTYKGISIFLLRGALGEYYMKDWTEEEKEEAKKRFG